jgi:creatinine amidohydrolase
MMPDTSLLSEMTWTEVDEALGERPVAILPVGSTQAQGPHLTVDAQTVVAQAAALRGVAKLKDQRIPALVLPPLSYTVAEFAAGFAGTIGVQPATATAVLRDICIATAKRFRAVVILHLNLETAHVESVKAAVEEARKAGVSVCHTDFGRKRWADPLGEAFARGEHAGAVVTSLMMAVAPARVRDAVRISLPPVDGPQAALKKGARSMAEAGAEDGYIGDPTAASAEDGDAHLEALAEAVALMVMEHLGSKA